MTRNKLLKFSLYSIIIAAIIFVINYFFYHFLTDDGFTTIFQEEAGKPFVANLIGQLGTLFVFLSGASLLAAFVIFDKKND